MKEILTGIVHRIEQAILRAGLDAGETVRDVRVGLRYTAVAFAEGAGVAYSVTDAPCHSCVQFSGRRPLAGKPAGELLGFLDSIHPTEVAVGLAAVNALANRPRDELTEGDVLEFISLDRSDDVAMVGHFGPLVAPLRERVRSLRILERVEKPQGDLLPVQDAPRVLGESHIALITSSSIVNHSLDELLSAAGNCREVVLLGASTPLLPEAFEGTAVTCLSGVVVAEAAEILRVVSEAGGMRQFSRFIRKVNLPLRR